MAKKVNNPRGLIQIFTVCTSSLTTTTRGQDAFGGQEQGQDQDHQLRLDQVRIQVPSGRRGDSNNAASYRTGKLSNPLRGGPDYDKVKRIRIKQLGKLCTGLRSHAKRHPPQHQVLQLRAASKLKHQHLLVSSAGSPLHASCFWSAGAVIQPLASALLQPLLEPHTAHPGNFC